MEGGLVNNKQFLLGIFLVLAAAITGMSCRISDSHGPGDVHSYDPYTAVHYFVYVANQLGGTVSVYTLNTASGVLTEVADSPFATVENGQPRCIAIHPSGAVLYAAHGTSPGKISAYDIDQVTGALTPLEDSPFATGAFPLSISVDPSGKFAYVVLNSTPGAVHAYSIDQLTTASLGSLTEVAGSPFVSGDQPMTVLADPAGDFVYVVNNGGNSVSGYTLNQTTGALTSTGPAAGAGTMPVAMAINSSGEFAYVTNLGDTDPGHVVAFSINQDSGVLSPIAAYDADVSPYSLAITPNDKFIYCANSGSNTISAYSINQSTGALTALGDPIEVGVDPRSITVDPSGGYLLVAHAGENTLTSYAINATTGALTQAGSISTGNIPVSVAAVKLTTAVDTPYPH
jgi:6-phosphogluconolactonase